MSWDRLSIFADAIGRLLEPGERALVLASATYAAGNEELGAQPPTFDGDTVVDMAFGLPSAYFMRLADEMVTGTSQWGWPGCAAEELAQALTSQPDMLLTDRRLLLVKIASGTARELWQCPRAWVLAVRLSPRFLQAGRVVMTLGDGSALAVVLGMFSSANASRVIAAWQPIAGELA